MEKTSPGGRRLAERQTDEGSGFVTLVGAVPWNRPLLS